MLFIKFAWINVLYLPTQMNFHSERIYLALDVEQYSELTLSFKRTKCFHSLFVVLSHSQMTQMPDHFHRQEKRRKPSRNHSHTQHLLQVAYLHSQPEYTTPMPRGGGQQAQLAQIKENIKVVSPSKAIIILLLWVGKAQRLIFIDILKCNIVYHMTFFVSPELSSEWDYVITHSVCSMQ